MQVIDTRELRIGNFVLWDNVDIHKVGGISHMGVTFKPHRHFRTIKRIYPIPLTPEILEKCGFNKFIDTTGPPINEEMEYYSDGEISVFFTNSGSLRLTGYHINQVGCTSLHQLQNLYYSLTGIELEVNL